MNNVIPLGPGSRMLTTREAAQRLGVSLRTVQLWVEADILPAARTPGGHRRIPYNAVEALALSTGLGGDPLAVPVAAQAAEATASAAPVERAPTRAQAKEVARARHMAASPMDVLLVSGDASWQERCEVAMQPYGDAVQLRFAENGYLALLQIGQKAPDMLVTSLDLHGMDGMVMVRTLESFGAMAATHVLLLTDLSDAELQTRGGVPAGVEVVSLPVSPDALAVRVGRALLARRQVRTGAQHE